MRGRRRHELRVCWKWLAVMTAASGHTHARTRARRRAIWQVVRTLSLRTPVALGGQSANWARKEFLSALHLRKQNKTFDSASGARARP